MPVDNEQLFHDLTVKLLKAGPDDSLVLIIRRYYELKEEIRRAHVEYQKLSKGM